VYSASLNVEVLIVRACSPPNTHPADGGEWKGIFLFSGNERALENWSIAKRLKGIIHNSNVEESTE
jgi:hypothetical protein